MREAIQVTRWFIEESLDMIQVTGWFIEMYKKIVTSRAPGDRIQVTGSFQKRQKECMS